MKKASILLTLLLLNVFISHAQCWTSVACGMDYSAAIQEDSTLWAWGTNTCGEFDSILHTYSSAPKCISNSHEWIKVDVGIGGCAIKANGTLWCWGDNGSGVWGMGQGQLRLHQIGESADWMDVSVIEHALALKKDHTLWAWGKNDKGQVGNSSLVQQPVPVELQSMIGWDKISAGWQHSLGIKMDGTLWAWGYNQYGQLGDSSYTDRSVPVQIGSAHDWKEVSAGGGHSLAIKGDGSLWAWGANGAGILGLGDTTIVTKNTPQRVGTDHDWLMISAGRAYSMALKKDSTLWVWGSSIRSQLGDGAPVNAFDHYRWSPYKITGRTWRAIASGDWNSAGIDKTKSMFGWGWAGFTGDGTQVTRNVPTRVAGDSCMAQPVTALDEMNVLQQTTRIFPNPPTEKLQLSFTLDEVSAVTISIGDVTGRTVILRKETTLRQGTHHLYIDVSGLNTGLYFLTLRTEKEKYATKFIIK